ncbi:MAG: hypothetical protein WC734_05540 [Patescibacteria group bacterium]
MENIFNNLILELHVPDFVKARKFYSTFNFHQISYIPAGSELGYMVLARIDTIGKTCINFYGDNERVARHTHFADYPTGTPRGYAVEITIPVSNVEELWKLANSVLDSSQIAQPLELKRWGKKDFRVVDPFGFYVRFTELVDWFN